MIDKRLDDLIRLVRQAGEAVLPFWKQDLVVENKMDMSPVTVADLAANRVLQAGLKALWPEIPVLSEEASDIPLSTRRQWQRWWLVDPLDGTKEFISGSDEFTVNVALIDQGRVVLGVVGLPVTGQCYFGGQGIGAWREEADGKRSPIAVRRQSPAGVFTVVASRRHSSPQQERLLAGLKAHVEDMQLVNIGSSLKFCLLAEGKADFYPRLAPTSQWDTAAAQGVLEGAGGEVLDMAGQAFTYEARETYLNASFMALPKAAEWRDEVIRQARALD